jgi:hypothetical protein
MTAAQKTERRGTIAICIAAATIALAAPAHADDSGQAFLADPYKAGATVCASMGNGMARAQENCPQAPGTYDGYLLPQGYGGKP